MKRSRWQQKAKKYRNSGQYADPVPALARLEKYCKQGQQRACGNLGTLFVQGYGGKDGPERAPGLLSAACEKNVFTACTSLGAVEAQKQDLDGASKLADRACQGGDADGCTLLGDLFAKSNDVLRAGVAYAKACQAGAPAGCYGQGVLLVHSGADRDKGLKLLQKACNDGETRACEAARSPDL